MSTRNDALSAWVAQAAARTQPDRIYWCDGSEREYERLLEEMLATETLLQLNPQTHPRCYLHRSAENDVARVEHLTYICTRDQDDAGPNNHWMDPPAAHEKLDALFAGCMRGRTMYVVPYCMGPLDSPYSRCGVEITDSPYVVANMRVMTRMGAPALARLERDGSFVRGLHSTGELDPDRRFIMHFPEELLIESYGSGYGGNALLGKKCHALRIGSWQAREEGWLAEHMLILGVESPRGDIHYIAAAFPSACGKTNMAMLVPPASQRGWKVWTVGDDIAWLHPATDGRLRAINPEAGFFGVVPGTSPKTNPHAYDMVRHDTIYTNVALTADNEPWWEGCPTGEPAIDWRGRPYARGNGPAAHPNSRFTVSARQNAAYTAVMDDPAGVPISAIVFGGRRRDLAPLVYEAQSWAHGVLVGAGVASETTAAATGTVGVVRRDPMAMKPFCGYNFADYWQHWLDMGARSDRLPRIFHVNWFRQDAEGRYLWPGFGENLRVLRWIIERCEGRGAAIDTPIGYLPAPGGLDESGLSLAPNALTTLLRVDREPWLHEMNDIGSYLQGFGHRLTQPLVDQQRRVSENLRNI